jgi:hypothetical protein
MKRCVNILYRIAVKLKTEGMFFKVCLRLSSRSSRRRPS